jgi:hypothetical protein
MPVVDIFLQYFRELAQKRRQIFKRLWNRFRQPMSSGGPVQYPICRARRAT